MSGKSVRQVNERNQVTIPPELLKQLAIRPGDLVHLSLQNGGIMLQPVEVVERKSSASVPSHAAA